MASFSFAFLSEKAKKELIVDCEERFFTGLQAAAREAARENLKFIALSGPTCSGKTTTAKRLTEELKKVGREVVTVSVDDFFLNRSELFARAEREGIPLDMDSVKAIDLALLQEVIRSLLLCLPTEIPHFDFSEGKRTGFSLLTPHKEDIYLFEGIQAIYPEVTSLFDREALLKIFISVGEGIETPWGGLSPCDLRLLRRLVRDSKFRGTGAGVTFGNWAGVRANEEENIEPYRGSCDLFLDSGMLYEPCVMREPALSLLEGLPAESPHAKKVEALCEILRGFPAIDPSLLPADSVMREFVG